MISITAVYVPRMGRVVRGATQAVVTLEYVRGRRGPRRATTRWILFREILPNIMAPIAADFALRITYAVIFIAGAELPRASAYSRRRPTGG